MQGAFSDDDRSEVQEFTERLSRIDSITRIVLSEMPADI